MAKDQPIDQTKIKRSNEDVSFDPVLLLVLQIESFDHHHRGSPNKIENLVIIILTM
jgi:hypothetical protein